MRKLSSSWPIFRPIFRLNCLWSVRSDTNGSAGFELEQSFAWAYDDLDRLTAETFDLGDDGSSTGDYVAVYEFDLNGNRLAKDTDHDYSGAVENMSADETIAYTYDENGRLLTETKDAAGTDDDRMTEYQYGQNDSLTAQTGKIVHEGLDDEGDVVEAVANEYDLAGRLASVQIDRTGGVGGVTVTTFAYDDSGNRVVQTAGTGEEAVTTTYLIDDNNLTGYSQTLEQTDRDYSEAVVKKTTYVVGADVLGQYVTEDSTTTGAIFLQDAHGSTRGLYATASAGLLDAALVTAGGSTWTKTLTYDAYGNALGFAPASAVTELLYNGESFNSRTGQQYLRARWYDSASGRFGAMDPWSGSAYSPQSYNGYNYCYSSPVMASDPSGMYVNPLTPPNPMMAYVMGVATVAGLSAAGYGLQCIQDNTSATAVGYALSAVIGTTIATGLAATQQVAARGGMLGFASGLAGMSAAALLVSASMTHTIHGSIDVWSHDSTWAQRGASAGLVGLNAAAFYYGGQYSNSTAARMPSLRSLFNPGRTGVNAQEGGTGGLTGQRHHAVSIKVQRATDAHPNLRGQYQARDPRFVTQAKDLPSHRGYEQWHRNLDAQVVDWVNRNPNATPADFEGFLRSRYSQPDLLDRFPNGMGGAE